MHTKRFLCFYLFLVSALCAQLGYGQNLTISDSGETGISGTNWSISGNILTSTENASIHPAVIEKALDLGELSIQVTGEKGTILVQSPIRSSKGHALKLIAQSSIQVYESIEISGGEIYLSVTDNQIAQGSICIDGDISVASASGKGGNILLEAKNITLSEKAVLTATGPTGGGNILVGGDWQGGASIENRVFEDPNKLKQATKVSMHAKAFIDASATENGNGGTVVLWSDIKNPTSVTKAHGTIFAKGGSISGDGGMIETSGYYLDSQNVRGSASAENGQAGLWLFDPTNVTIGSSGSSAGTSNNGVSTITASSISSLLDGGSSVTVTTGTSGSDLGDITINTAITKNSGTEVTLTFVAANSIVVNESINHTGGSALNLIFDADNSNPSGTTRDGGGITILEKSLSTGGGDVTFGGSAYGSYTGGSLYVGGGSTSIAINAGSGNVLVKDQLIIANSSSDGFVINSTANVTIHGTIDSGNSYTAVSGDKTWEEALNDADNTAGSYLATITSAAENAIAIRAANYSSAWLGGRRVTGIGTDNAWRWVSEPGYTTNTAPIFFYQGAASPTLSNTSNSGGSSATGYYNNWNAWQEGDNTGGEPNNWNGSAAAPLTSENESAIQFTGTIGVWNDLPKNSSKIPQYIRETNLPPSNLKINTTGDVILYQNIGVNKKLENLLITASNVNLPNISTKWAINEDIVLNANLKYANSNSITTTLLVGDDIFFNKDVIANGIGKLNLDLKAAIYSGEIVFEGNVTTKGGVISTTSAIVSFQSEYDQSINTTATSGDGGDLIFNSNVQIGVLDSGDEGKLNFITDGGDVLFKKDVNASSSIQRQLVTGISLNGWSSTSTLYTGVEEWGTILGAFDYGDNLTAPLDFNSTAKNISFNFYRLESWDNEYVRFYIDNSKIGEFQLINNGEISSTTNAVNLTSGYSVKASPSGESLLVNNKTFNNNDWTSQKLQIDINTPSLDNFTLKVNTNLGSNWYDEGWGIENLLIRELPDTYNFNGKMNVNTQSGKVTFEGEVGNEKPIGLIELTAYEIQQSNEYELASSGVLSITTITPTIFNGVLSGNNISLNKYGTYDLFITQDQSFTGNINIVQGDLVVKNDTPSITPNITGTSHLSIVPNSTSFSEAFTYNTFTISNTLSGLTIGTVSNTANIIISKDINIAGPISIYGGHLNIDNDIETTASGDIILKGYTSAANYGINLASNKSIKAKDGHIDIHATGGTTYYGIYLGSSSKIEAKGSGKKLEITAVGHSTGGGIYMDTSTTLSSTSDINIYANGGTSSNGIQLLSHAQIRSSAGDVHINAIGYRGVYGKNNSNSIRAHNDLTINALASETHGIYSDNINVACSDGVSCGWVSDEGNIIINSINKANYYYTTYLRNPLIANGTETGKGNITYTGTSTQGGIKLDSDLGYIHAEGDINLIGYGGSSSGDAIHISQEGPTLISGGGGTVRSENGDVIFSAFGANNAGVYFGNNDNIRIVALAGDIIMQGASLSTNTNNVYDTSNTAIGNAYTNIYNAIVNADDPRSVSPSGFATADPTSGAKAKYWPVHLYGGTLLALNNPYEYLNDGTAPTSGGSINIDAEQIYYFSSSGAADRGAAVAFFDGLDLFAYDSISIKGDSASNGLDQYGGNHGIIIYSTTTDIRSFNSSISLTGYANGYTTYGHFTSNWPGAGVAIHSDHNTIRAKTDLNVTGVNPAGIGIWLREGGTNDGLRSDTGNITIKGLSNSIYWGTYVRQKVTATLGDVYVSGAGKQGGVFYDDENALTAGGNIYFVGYSTGEHGLYFEGNTLTSGGSITLSANSGSSSSSYYGLYSASAFTADQNIIIQGAQLAASTADNLSSAATDSPIVFATADTNADVAGYNGDRTVYIREDLTATNGYIKILGETNLSADLKAGNGIIIDGGDIDIAGTFETTEANADIKILSDAGIYSLTNISLTSGTGGDIWLISDADNSSGGSIYMPHNLTINSNGGEIRLAGGNTLGTGYATGLNTTYAEGIDLRGTVSVNSSNGNIVFKGKSYSDGVANSNGAYGVGLWNSNNKTINSGTGTIYIEGISQDDNNSSYNYGVVLKGTTVQLISANTSSDAIKIIGKNTAGDGVSYGRGISLQATTNKIHATGSGGGITLQGEGRFSFTIYGTTEILAASGPITLESTNAADDEDIYIDASDLDIGSKSGVTGLTSSSSNIIIRADTYSFNGLTPDIATSGNVTWEPISSSNSFGYGVKTSWFSWNQNSQTMSGLTIGKPTNENNVTVNSALSVTGPISVYGGDITINENLTSTFTDSDILLKGSDISLATNKSITTNGGDIIFWANRDNITNGAGSNGIILNGSNNLSSNNGKIVLAGGLDDGSNNGTSGDGIPDGFTYRADENIQSLGIGDNVSIDSDGGQVILRGQAFNGVSGNTNLHGIGIGSGFSLDAGSGSVLMHGKNFDRSAIYNGNGGFAIQSSSTNNPAIEIIADSNNAPIILSRLAPTNALIQSTSSTGGGIKISGNYPSGSTPGNALIFGKGGNTDTAILQVLSQSGSITFSTEGSLYLDQGVFLGNRENATAINSITPSITSSSADIKLSVNNYVLNDGSELSNDTSGTFTLEPASNNFSNPITYPIANLSLNSSVSGLTIGKPSNTENITISSAQTIAGPISIYGGDITLSNSLTASGTLLLQGSGATTQSAAISATTLSLQGSGTFTLNNSENHVESITAGTATQTTGNISLTNKDALIIGDGSNGIQSSGTIQVGTLSGNLTLANNISTDNTTNSAIKLYADQGEAAGSEGQGNILISGTPSLTTGSGGRASLYSGNPVNSSGLVTLVGGNTNVRFGVDSSTISFTPALSSGNYALFRAGGDIIDAVVETIPDRVYSGLAQTVSPTVTFNSQTLVEGTDYTVSFTNNLNVGTASLTLTGIGGYTGTKSAAFNIIAKTLTITAVDKTKVYDSSVFTPTDYTVTYDGFENGETKSVLSGTITYTGTAVAATASGTYVITPGGLTSSNYSITYVSGELSITQRNISETSIAAIADLVYTGAAQTVSPTVTFNSQTLVEGTDYTTSFTGNTNAGTASITLTGIGNYTGTKTQGFTITSKTLTITAADKTKVYDSAVYTPTDYTVTYDGFVGVEDESVLSGTLTFTGTALTATNSGTYEITPGELTSSNYSITYVSGELNITQRSINEASIAAIADLVYTGSAQTVSPTVTFNSLTLVEGTDYTTSFTGNTNVGSASITLTGIGNYTGTETQGFTITAKTLTITAVDKNKVYDGASYTPSGSYTVTYDGFVGVEDESVLSGTITYTGTALTATASGTYVITPGGLTSSNYSITYVSGELSISQRSINEASISAIADLVYTGSAQTVSPTVTFNSLNLVEGTDYTTSFTGNTNAGTASITLTGVGNYTGSKTQGFTITTKTLTITAVDKTKVYDGASYTPSGSYTVTYDGFVGVEDESVLSGTITYTGTAIAATASGTYVITPGGLTSSNYSITYVSGELSISQKPITIAITNQTKVFGASDPSPLNAHTISVGSVYGQTPTGVFTRTLGEDVGIYTIGKGDLTYGSNYIETFVNGNLSITARTITVTAAAKSKVYGESDPSLTYTATPAVGQAVVSGSSATVTFTGAITRDAGENAGTYSITLGTLTNTNYTIDYVGADFTITKAPTAIEDGDSDPATETLSDTIITFGDSDILLTPTSSNTADYTFTSSDSSVASITTTSTNTAAIRNLKVGSAIIIISQGEDANYQAKTVSYTLTVNPLPVTVTPTATQSKTYGEADLTLTYTTTPALSSSLNNSSTVTFTGSLSRTLGENASTYSITIGTLTNTNYALSFTETDYTINRRPITISAEAKTKVYGATDPSLTSTITAGSIVSGDSASGVLTRTSGEAAGTYTITQNTLTYGNNYDETYQEEYLTITNATVTLTVLDYTKVYDGQFIESSNLSFTATGLVNGDTIDDLLGTPVYTVSGTATNTVGTYSITLSGLSHPSYNIEYVGANATITPATLTITADALSKTYGDADPELTHTTIGLISGDTPTGTLTRTVGEDVGTYTISNDNLTYGNNYIEVFESGTLTITTKAVSVTANAQTKVHGDIDPELTYSVSPAINTTLANNTSTITFTGSLSRTLGEDVGTYAIGIGTLTNTNFDITFTPADLTITKLPVVITPTASQSKTYGEVDPTLTYTTLPILNSTLTNTTSTVTFTGSLSRTTGENVNDYIINIGTLTNTNYDITLNPETFEINKRAIGITLTGTVSKVYDQNNTATLTSSNYTITGLYSGEVLEISNTSGLYDNAQVGNSKTVSVTLTPTDYTLITGASLDNYILLDTASGTVGAIIPKSLTVNGVTAADKQYDGTTRATVSTSTISYTGLIDGDTVSITPTGTFDTFEVGNDKTVNLTYSLLGVESGNYTTTGQVTTTASILANDNVLDFDGSDDYIRLMSASSSAFDLGNSLFTIEFNIKFDLVNNAMIFSARNSPSGSDQYQLQIDNGKLFFYVYHTSHGTESGLKIKLESINTIEADKWYHIAIVRSANFTYEMYINGENQQTKSLTTSNNDDNLRIREFSIGNYYTVNPYTTQGRYFDGQLDEFRLWTEARSLAQIQDNINKKMPVDGNLAVYYSFDQGVSGGDNSIISNVLDTSGPFNLAMVNFAKSGSSSNFVANTRSDIKVPPTLTLTGTTKVYGDPDFTLSVSSTSTGTITYTTNDSNVASIDAATGSITITGVGTTTITATQTATSKYTSAIATASVYVAPKSISFSGITASDKVYDGTTTAATATDTLSFTGLVGSDQVLVSPTGTFDNSNVGLSKTVSLTYTYSGSEIAKYTITGQATTTASITAKPITIIPTAGQSKTYGLADATLSYTISPSTLPNGTAISLGGTLSRTTGENVGTYTITIGTVSDTNYDITLNPETFEINKKTITVSGITASDKVYDANTTASVDLSGITFDTLSFTDTITATVTGTFDTKDIGTSKTVSLTATYSSTALDNYTIVDQTTTTASITARTITATLIGAVDKIYNATTSATLTPSNYALGGFVAGESATITQTFGAYDTKDIGTSKEVTVSLTDAYAPASGTLLSNYSLAATATGTVGNITAKTLTITNITVLDKVYDGTPNSSVNSSTIVYNGLESGDDVSINSTSGVFDNEHVGVGKTVTLTNTFAGTDLNNYALVDQALATASVTAKAVTATLTGTVSKIYNGTTSATLTSANYQLTGFISGESATITKTSGTYDTKEKGTNKMVTVGLTDGYAPASGTLLSNYVLAATATGTVGTITAQTLTVTGIVVLDKVYDGTVSSTVMTNTIVYEGLATGDNVYINTSSGVFADANVGIGKTVNLTNTYAGTDLTNYTVVNQATTTASITTKPITIIPTAGQSKTYGLADATLSYTISPSTLPNGTAISLGGTLSRTTGENVGTYTITIGTVSDTNYDITLNPGTFEITKKTITVSGITVSDKVYDANTTASVDLSGITFTGKESGDTITATVTGTFDTKDIGTGKTVTLTATYSSTALDNYTIVDQTTTTASITARTVSVTGDTGVDKTFDDTINLPLGEIGYGNLTGVLDGEDVSLTGVGVYDAATQGSRAIEIGTVTLTGADKGNYTLNWTNGSGTIAKKTLTVTANNDAKFVTEPDASGYNGVSYDGFEGDDGLSDINVSGLTISRTNSTTNTAAGTYVGTLVPSGVTATNYDISYVNGDYTIIPADKLLLKVTNQTTTYGTSATYTITSAQYYKTGTGLVNLTVPTPSAGVYPINDGASTINIEIVPDSPVNSSAGKLSVGSYGLAANVVSGSSGNFSNNIEVIGNHSVAKQSLTASASSVSKEYDATTAMAGVRLSLATLETGDIVTVNGTGSFSSPLVGTGLTYTIAGLSLSGTDAGNYYLSSGASFSGNNGEITKAPLTITANDDNGVDTNPAYSGGNGVTYQGFKGSDSEADLSGTLAYTGTSQGATAAGTYAIEPTGITSSNYSITFVAGTLTIIVGDSDGDGVRDPLDNCPTTPNADQADADGDGIGDVCDNAPNTPNADQADSDGDGIADAEDNDDDNDGVPDTEDDFPTDPNETTDTDGDGQGDNLDTDIDNDGVINTIDNCIYTPNTDQLDTDADGIGNACDNDDDNDGYSDADEIACGSDPLLASSKPLDTDGDGIPNCLDDDDDNDGYSDSDELGCDCACEDTAKSDYSYENSDPLDATSVPADEDKDGIPDCFDKDKDNDGVLDEEDAFPLDKNEWTDSDADGIGNNADEDDDNDGQLDVDEIACGSDPLDNASLSPDFDQDNIPDCVDQDSDNDGVLNSNDAFPLDPTEWTDTDLDGIGNNTDEDDDNDGYLDLDELECNSNPLDVNDLPGDLDQDGIPDCKDNDMDGDGCINTQDVFPRDPSECEDTDGDGLGNNVDVDDDNDGVIDQDDAFPQDPGESKDADGDGIGNNADPDDNNDGFDDEKVLASGVLTPNSSGLESTWKVINIDQYPQARVSVYDKNGLEVFSAQSYQNDWRGTYKNSTNPLPAGSYYYVVELNTGEEPITGWLYITY
ncbi:YDG domain-containing protein [Flavobacteriaceae bacterium LSUCC0859]|nr:YDG domain-containing protein [Flavobacteriaceae bacterium LSUCC0859]